MTDPSPRRPLADALPGSLDAAYGVLLAFALSLPFWFLVFWVALPRPASPERPASRVTAQRTVDVAPPLAP